MPIQFIENRNEIKNDVRAPLGISCGFGIIFRKKQIELFKHGIWNIHYGKLPDIRSRHPISWAFLLGNKEFWVTLHEINEEIDQGYLLAEERVERDLNDTQIDIESKFEAVMDRLIKNAISNYLTSKKKLLGTGAYYESLAGKYRQIRPVDFDAIFIFNMFKAQFKYGGVMINGRRYTECVFYNEDFPRHYENYDIYVCKDGVKIGVR